MKNIFKIIGKLLLLLLMIGLVRTAFDLQANSFTYPDQLGNNYGIPMIFSIIMILIAGFFIYIILNDTIKTKNNKLMFSGLFVIIVISNYFFQFKKKADEKSDLKEIIDTSGISYKYNERLIAFTSPVELKEEKPLESNMTIKAFGNKDLALIYIEMDGEEIETSGSEDIKEVIKQEYIDFTLPKKFFKQACAQFGEEVEDEDIRIEKINEDIFFLGLISGSNVKSYMYFVKKDYFFSTLQVVSPSSPFNNKVIDEILDSVNIK